MEVEVKRRWERRCGERAGENIYIYNKKIIKKIKKTTQTGGLEISGKVQY